MKNFAIGLIGALCVVLWTASTFAAPQTVTGKIIDLYCYDVVTKANAGMDHTQGKECAWACIRYEAQPVGLLTADGKVYQLAGGVVANNNQKVWPHVLHTVTITGDVVEKAGMMILTASDLTMVSK